MPFQFTDGRFRALDADGSPITGGFLFSYASGTTTPQATFTDSALGTPNTNPVVLDARGEAQVWLGANAYTFLLKDALGVTLWSVDGVTDPAAATTNLTVSLTAGTYAETVPFVSAGGDDAVTLQALAAANAFKRILVRRGATLNFFSECVITASSVLIDLNGGSIVQHTPDINSLTFKPTTAGATTAFLDECGIANGTISHSAVTASTVGWALNLVQCNGFRARDMRFNNGDVAVYGGQFNSFSGCKFFASSGAYKGTGSALLHLIDAPLPAGAYQRPLTFMLDNPFMAASQLRDACVRVHSADGFTITSGYVNFALNANVLFLSDHANTVISNIALNGLYNDCVRQAGGTKCGVEIRDDSDATSTVYSVQIDGGWIGNGSLSGILSRKPETQSISVNGVLVENFTAWGFDHQGGTLVDVQLNACRFLSCGTNGASGDVRLQGGSSYNLAGNTHRFSANVCVSRSGNWVTGSIGDCHNVSGAAADTVTTETLTNPIVMNGNTSNYGGIVNSWKGGQETYLAYASNALAVAAGLQVGRLYRNGDNLCVVH